MGVATIGKTYGYDRQYAQTATEALERLGVVPKGVVFHWQTDKYEYTEECVDVASERDLHHGEVSA